MFVGLKSYHFVTVLYVTRKGQESNNREGKRMGRGREREREGGREGGREREREWEGRGERGRGREGVGREGERERERERERESHILWKYTAVDMGITTQYSTLCSVCITKQWDIATYLNFTTRSIVALN